jgi:hypothetical protein
MELIQKTKNFERLNLNEMYLIKGGSDEGENDAVIVYIGGKPYRITKDGPVPL